jgi:predicted methyltransferase MtxX (methanogen marker protein 4)
MKRSFVDLLKHHQAMIGKKVTVVSKAAGTVGHLKSVDQIVYGVQPTYNLILENDTVVKVSGILVPYYSEDGNNVIEHYVFEPYSF